jgi:hypothetical protein
MSSRVAGGKDRNGRNKVVGWLKLTKKDAETLLEKSGKKGIFINKNIDTSKERPHFVWTKHEKDETDEAYYQRCLRLSGERGQPMCLRKGLGNDIGFTKKSDEDIEKKPKRISDFWSSQGLDGGRTG